MTKNAVLATWEWTDNAEMMADVARLGYLNGLVYDCTYGEGNFWSVWKPPTLVASDIVLELSPCGKSIDFRDMPWSDRVFDAVVFDPPYKLNGTPDPELDKRYGVHIPTRWQDRMQLILDGAREASRLANRYLLVKCQDQVCSGKVRWQTDEVTQVVTEDGSFRKRDRLNLVSYRPQPNDRSQKHARHNSSSLLVFERMD